MWISKKKYAQMCQLKAEMQEEISDLRLSLLSSREALVEAKREILSAKKWMRRRDPKTGCFVKMEQGCGE
jgi:inactivated superfamily I helicase